MLRKTMMNTELSRSDYVCMLVLRLRSGRSGTYRKIEELKTNIFIGPLKKYRNSIRPSIFHKNYYFKVSEKHRSNLQDHRQSSSRIIL